MKRFSTIRKRLLHSLQGAFLAVLAISGISLQLRADDAEIIVQDGFTFEVADGGRYIYLVDLPSELKHASALEIPYVITYNGTRKMVDFLKFTSDAVTDIQCAVYIAPLNALENIPNLVNYNIVPNEETLNAYEYTFSKDGLVISHSNRDGTTGEPYEYLWFYPPGREETVFDASEFDMINISGSRFMKHLILGNTLSSISLGDLPDLEEISFKSSNSNFVIHDGGIYRKESNGYMFEYFPVKYSETCRIWEKTTSCGRWPNVKRIIIDSPDVSFKGGTLGDNVEEIIFNCKTNKEFNAYYDKNSKTHQYNQNRIYGKNLRYFEFPSNVYISLWPFCEVNRVRSDGKKVYYEVSYNNCPKLESIKGGYLAHNACPVKNIYIDSKNDDCYYEADGETSILSDWEVRPINDIEIHFDSPYDYSGLPYSPSSTSLPIYYDKPIFRTDRCLSATAGVVFNCGKTIPDLSKLNKLRKLTLIFDEGFGGLGTSHFGNMFSSKSSNCESVNQYNEDGSTSQLRRPAGLKEVAIYGDVDFIPYGYFSNFISLESVSLPSSVVAVGDRAFYGCSKLSKLTVNADYPPVAYPETFVGVRKSSTTLLVPEQSISLYKNEDGWKDFFVEGMNNQLLAVIKSIENAGDIASTFSGNMGEVVTLSASTRHGYDFIGWFDVNLNFISSASTYSFVITEPTVLNAVFLPSVESVGLDCEWSETGNIIMRVPHDDNAAYYRVSAYKGSIRFTPDIVETFGIDEIKIIPATRGDSAMAEIVMSGLSPETDYNMVVEALDEDYQATDAYMNKITTGLSGIETVADGLVSPEVRYVNNSLFIKSDHPMSISVVSIDGRTLYANSHIEEVELPGISGLVIINVNGVAKKYMLK